MLEIKGQVTIDETPMAYKSLGDIIDVIRDSVDVIEIMKPVYNFKASDEAPPWKSKKNPLITYGLNMVDRF